jgi:hypothetical protein
MPLMIDYLRDIFKGRLNATTKTLNIVPIDFDTEETRQLFIRFTGPAGLTITNADINPSGEILIVTGKTVIWQQQDAPMRMEIVLIDGAPQFLLHAEMPAGWSFVSSFPKITDTLVKNLVLNNVSLDAASYAHERDGRQLIPGLNFYGATTAEGPLKYLKSISPGLDKIVLAGTIDERNADNCKIDLHASLKKAITVQLPDPTLHINNTTEPSVSVTVSGDFSQQPYDFNVSIRLPSLLPLDVLENSLRKRIVENTLTISGEDFGTETAAKFEQYIWRSAIDVKNPVVIRENAGSLRITGNAEVYGNSNTPNNIILSISAGEEKQFQFELEVLPDTATWKWSSLVENLSVSFFDDIVWKQVRLVALSAIKKSDSNLVEGLNFIGTTSAKSGALLSIDIVAPGKFDDIRLQGTVNRNEGGGYETTLSTPVNEPVVVDVLGMQSITVPKGSNLVAFGNFNTDEEKQQQELFFTGSLLVAAMPLDAKLYIPVGDRIEGWYFEVSPDTTVLPAITSLMKVPEAKNANNWLPATLLQLSDMKVARWDTLFVKGTSEHNVTRWTLTPKQKDASWDIIPSQLQLSGLSVEVTTGNYYNPVRKFSTAVDTTIRGTITIGTKKAVTVSITASDGDWELLIESGDGKIIPDLNDLARLSWKDGTHNSGEFLNSLPKRLVDDTTEGLPISLKEIRVGFDPFIPDLSFVSFELSQNRNWELIKDIFSISGWSVSMLLDVRDNFLLTGQLKGTAKIHDVADIAILAAIRKEQTDIDISLEEGTEIRLGSLGKLLQLTKGATNQSLPFGLDALADLTIDQLQINLTPAADGPVNFLHFNLYGASKWTIVKDWLEIDGIRAGIDLEKTSDVYQSKGFISGTVTIGGIDVWIYTGKELYTSPWALELATKNEIELPGLSHLARWMMPETMVDYIPAAFMPFGEGFLIEQLYIGFDLSAGKLKEINFSIRNKEKWEAIKGYVELDNAIVSALVSPKVKDGNQLDSVALYAGIEADLTLGNDAVCLHFSAQYQNEKPHWIFEGNLIKEIRLTDLLQKLNLATRFVIPKLNWLPDVAIKTAEVMLQPQAHKFSFKGEVSATLNWNIPFTEEMKLNMIGLKGAVIIDKKDVLSDGPDTFQADISGRLNFSTFTTILALRLGSKDSDTIFTGSLTTNEVQQFDLSKFADGITNQKGATTTWAALRPADMSAIRFKEAFTYYNYTKSKWLIYGAVEGFGQAALLTHTYTIKNIAGNDEIKRGYFFSFSLENNFRFGRLFPSLQIIDDILIIREAGIAVSSYDTEQAAKLKNDIDQALDAAKELHAIQSPIAIASDKLPADKFEKGTHVYAILEFKGNLFATFLQLKQESDGASAILYASFASDATKTVFRAQIAPFSIFDTIRFQAKQDGQYISMQYTPEKKQEFSLEGAIGLHLFNNDYSFDGSLVINEDHTSFNLLATLNKELRVFESQLPPLFTLSSLALNLVYYFKKDTPPVRTKKLLTAEVAGDIRLLNLSLKARLLLVNTTPVLVSVVLTENFSIQELIGNILAVKQAWNPSLFNIVFLKDEKDKPGRLYYFDQQRYIEQIADAKPLEGGKELLTGYDNGYWLQSRIELTLLTKLEIILSVHVEKDKGLYASVALANPVEIFILEFAGKQKTNDKYTGGPELLIDTRGDQQVFGFSTGINFFQTACLLTMVTIGRDKDSPTNDTRIEASFSLPMQGFNDAMSVFRVRNNDQYSYKNQKDPSLTVSYCKREGFKVKGWGAFDFITEMIDIAKTLKEKLDAMSSSGCQALCKWVIKEIYTGEFSISPDFEIRNGGLYLKLNGEYTLKFRGSKLASIPLPDIAGFTVPPDLSLKGLPGKIKDALGEVAYSLLEGLIRNGEQWAKIAGVLFMEQAAEVAADMFCKQAITNTVRLAIVAAGSSAVAATAAGVAPEVLIAGAAGAVTLVFANPGSGGGGSGGGGQQGGDKAPAAPHLDAFEFKEKDGRQLLLTRWQKETGVTYKYRLQHSSQNGETAVLYERDKLVVGEQADQIDLDKYNGGTYQVWIQAVNENGNSDWKILQLNKCSNAVITDTFVNESGNICVRWNWPGTEKKFRAALYREETKEYIQLSGPQETQKDNEFVFVVQTLEPGAYLGAIQVLGEEDGGVPSGFAKSSQKVTQPRPPSDLRWNIDGDYFKLMFTPSPDLIDPKYKVVISRTLIQPSISDEFTGNEWKILKQNLLSGPFNIWLQTTSNSTTLACKIIKVAVPALEMPEGVTLALVQQDIIRLAWNLPASREDIKHFEAQLWADVPTNIYQQGTTENNNQSFIDFQIDYREDYFPGVISGWVKAIAQPPILDSIFSLSPDLIQSMPTPEVSLTITDDGGGLILSWKNVPENGGYEIALLTSDGLTARVNKDVVSYKIERNWIWKIGESAVFSIAPLPLHGGGLCMRPARITVARIEKPVATLNVDNVTKKIRISWNAVNGSSGYNVEAHAEVGVMSITTADTFAEFSSASPGDDQFPMSIQLIAKSANGNRQLNSLPVDFFVRRLKTPALNAQVGNSAGKIIFTWNNEQETNGFVFSINKRETSPPFIKGSRQYEIPLSQLPAGEKSLTFELKAVSADPLTCDSLPANITYQRLPVIEEVKQHDDRITIEWKRTEGATGYTWILKNNDTNAERHEFIDDNDQKNDGLIVITLPLQDSDKTDHHFVFAVKATTTAYDVINGELKWFDILSPVEALVAPSEVMVYDTEDYIKAAWSPVARNVDYQVLVLDENGNPVVPQPHVYVNNGIALIRKAALRGSVGYTVKVRTITKAFINYLANGDGEDELAGWDFNSDNWRIEPSPDILRPSIETCFVTADTSKGPNKTQRIDLLARLIPQTLLDKSPEIRISDWAYIEDSNAQSYSPWVDIMSEDQRSIASFAPRRVYIPSGKWGEAYYLFKDYQGVPRYINFLHSVVSARRSGMNGKLTGSRVEVRVIPEEEVKRSDWTRAKNQVRVPFHIPIRLMIEVREKIIRIFFSYEEDIAAFDVEIYQSLSGNDPYEKLNGGITVSGPWEARVTYADKLNPSAFYKARIRPKTKCFTNLLINGDASRGDTAWKLSGIRVDEAGQPTYVAPKTDKCFILTDRMGEMSQEVDLLAAGISRELLNAMPEFEIGVWVRTKNNTPGSCRLNFLLLNESGVFDNQPFDSYRIENSETDQEWQYIRFTSRPYAHRALRVIVALTAQESRNDASPGIMIGRISLGIRTFFLEARGEWSELSGPEKMLQQ